MWVQVKISLMSTKPLDLMRGLHNVVLNVMVVTIFAYCHILIQIQNCDHWHIPMNDDKNGHISIVCHIHHIEDQVKNVTQDVHKQNILWRHYCTQNFMGLQKCTFPISWLHFNDMAVFYC